MTWIAQLYNPLHPAVLRLMQFSVEAALQRGTPIGIWGEMPESRGFRLCCSAAVAWPN